MQIGALPVPRRWQRLEQFIDLKRARLAPSQDPVGGLARVTALVFPVRVLLFRSRTGYSLSAFYLMGRVTPTVTRTGSQKA